VVTCVLVGGVGLLAAGCGPGVRIHIVDPQWPGGHALSTTQAYYAEQATSYQLIAKVPRAPDVLEVLSLGAIKDASYPTYLLLLDVPKDTMRQEAKVGVLILPWELGSLLEGTGRIAITPTVWQRLHVEFSSDVKVTVGALRGGGSVEVDGTFARDDARWQQLVAEWLSKKAWLTRKLKALGALEQTRIPVRQ